MASWPNSLAGQPGFRSVRPAASWTHVYTRRERPGRWRKAVEAIPLGRPGTWLGRSASTWQVTVSAKSVELPHGPINSPLWWKSEHTHHTLKIPHAKLSFLV
jgi:hypothetical protein